MCCPSKSANTGSHTHLTNGCIQQGGDILHVPKGHHGHQSRAILFGHTLLIRTKKYCFFWQIRYGTVQKLTSTRDQAAFSYTWNISKPTCECIISVGSEIKPPAKNANKLFQPLPKILSFSQWFVWALRPHAVAALPSMQQRNLQLETEKRLDKTWLVLTWIIIQDPNYWMIPF